MTEEKQTKKLKKIERHISNVGKGFFIDNYELFEEKFYGISNRILKKVKEKRHTKGSQDTTLSGGIGVIRSGLGREILIHIIKTSTDKIKTKAEKLLKRLDERTKKITVNAYERDPKKRQECIDAHGSKGYNCAICKFNFEKIYGNIGKEYIHVHHEKPLSEINKKYKINPAKDLIPVCPNCHAMLHKREPMYSIDEIKKLIKKNKRI